MEPVTEQNNHTQTCMEAQGDEAHVDHFVRVVKKCLAGNRRAMLAFEALLFELSQSIEENRLK